MLVVPALDLSNSLAVHAKCGDRINYQPITSHLCHSSNPIEIIKCLLDLYNFKSIYIADLDTLQKQGNNINIIESIYGQFPKLEIWLDTGTDLIKHYLEHLKISSVRLILSTESIDSISTFTSVISDYPAHRFLFSIDYISGEILGPNSLLQSNPLLPADIIILNLDNVGSNQGVKLPTQLDQQALIASHNLFYGGGIRNINDVNELKSIGFTGALISSALHNSEITRDDLCVISQ